MGTSTDKGLCRTCSFWDKDDNRQAKTCTCPLFCDEQVANGVLVYEPVRTGPYFGCVHHDRA